MSKIQIAVAYHKNSEIIKNDCLLPIQVGKACSDFELDMQGDNTGDNISEKNFSYAELTATYWLWKNSAADIKGLFHYRRYLDLNSCSVHRDEEIYEYPLTKGISSSNFLIQVGIYRENIIRLLNEYSILTRRREDLHSWSNFSVMQHYAEEHHIEHLEKALEVIKKDYPDFYPSANKLVNGHTSYFTNILITNRKSYEEYCSWMFDIIFKIEQTLNLYDKTLAPNTKRARWAGFLGERLSAIYIQKQIDDGKRIGEFPAVVLVPNITLRWYECNTYDMNLYVKKQENKIMVKDDLERPLISVCIAAYNVGKYVEKCVLSVTNQSLKNIEIIIVNDGSQDNTLSIINKIAKRDERIKIIDQENRGAGCARNAALNLAKGKYIHFLDGDDFIESNFLEKMVMLAEKDQSDLVISTHICFDDSTGNELYRSTLPHTLVGHCLTVESTPDLLMVPCHVWDKIYLSKLIKNLYFLDKSNGEDILFWYQAILNATSVSVLREPLYHYRMSPNSVQVKPKDTLNCFNNMRNVEEYMAGTSRQVREYFEIFKQTLVGHMMYRARIALARDENFRKEFYKQAKWLLKNNSLSLSEEMQKKKEYFHCDFKLIERIKKGSFRDFEKIIGISSPAYSLYRIFKYLIKGAFVSGKHKIKYQQKINGLFSKLDFPVEYKLFGIEIFKFSHNGRKNKINILGLPVFKRNIEDIYERFYILGIPVVSKNKIKTKLLGITIRNNIDAYLIRTFDYLGWKINDVYQQSFDDIGWYLHDVLPKKIDAIKQELKGK